jgi:hypothetical protein
LNLGKAHLSSRCLAVDISSSSTISAFRRHVTVSVLPNSFFRNSFCACIFHSYIGLPLFHLIIPCRDEWYRYFQQSFLLHSFNMAIPSQRSITLTCFKHYALVSLLRNATIRARKAVRIVAYLFKATTVNPRQPLLRNGSANTHVATHQICNTQQWSNWEVMFSALSI